MNDELLTTIDDVIQPDKEERSKVVVRLSTSSWYDHDGMHIKKTLRYLKRQCKGFNFIHEDCCMIGSSEVFPRIINLDECKDGIYEVITCNERSSWETPHIIEDYDYKLIPYDGQGT